MNDDALQALLDMGDRLTASMRENPDGTHTTDDEWAWLLTLSASTVHLIRNLREARVDRDALAAKVADTGERIARRIETTCAHDGRNGKTWCCPACHDAANLARSALSEGAEATNCGKRITGIYGSEETVCVRPVGHTGGHHSIFARAALTEGADGA